MLRYKSGQTYEFKDLSLPLFKNNSTIPDKRYFIIYADFVNTSLSFYFLVVWHVKHPPDPPPLAIIVL